MNRSEEKTVQSEKQQIGRFVGYLPWYCEIVYIIYKLFYENYPMVVSGGNDLPR
jgi:hypothetical protein